MYTGVGLTTLATLVLELSLTRIFSVVFYYHFAFLAISIALFGLGAGGVFSYVVARWKGDTFAKLGGLALANSAAVVIALAYILSPFVRPGGAALIVVYFASALPFFIAGAVVSLAIGETIARVDRVYFFDLLGAAGGCLAFFTHELVFRNCAVLKNQFRSVGGTHARLVANLLSYRKSLGSLFDYKC